MNLTKFTAQSRIFILFVFLQIFVSVAATAQTITINFKDTPLKEAFVEITKQSGYNFVYSSDVIDVNQKVTIKEQTSVSNIAKLLDNLFFNLPISYNIKGKQIVLKEHQQTVTSPVVGKLSGKITDDAGEPLVGVAVKNETAGAIAVSDIDGNYFIAAKEGDRLSFSLIGMETWYATAGKSTIVNVPMKTDVIALGDVVVTGFQTLSKERATGSFAKVTSVELEKNNTTSISGKIASAMNGVYVSPDGGIEIRGLATLNTADGKADPLIVVDGFPVEGGISSINPDEIESITVLRDAAAASIYGIKSANGVIVVSRKSAERTKFNINGSANYSLTENPSLSYLNMMNAAEAVDYDWEAIEKGMWKTQLSGNNNKFSELGQAYLLLENGNTAAANEIKERLASYGDLTYKQYEKELFRKSQTGQYNISITGGSKNSEYYVSGRIEDYDSMRKGNSSIKYFLNSRLKLNLTDKLTFTIATTNNYSNGTSNSPISIYTYSRSVIPYEPLIVNGKLNALSSRSISYKKRDLAQTIGLLPNGIEYNPINDLNYSDNKYGSSYNRYQASLGYLFDFGLNLDVKYQYENGNTYSKYIYSPQTYTGATQINSYVSYDGNEATYLLNRDKSQLSKSTSDWKSHIVRAVASYDKAIGKKHYVSALTGIEFQNTQTDNISEFFAQYDKVTGFVLPDIFSESSFTNWADDKVNILSKDFVNYNNSTAYQRFFSFFFNGGYTFNNKYNITGSFRIDQSNIFGTDTKYRYKPMWSAGASWNIYKENFMSSLSWLNNLTLRATYGLTGMIDKSTSPYVIITKDKDSIVNDYAGFSNAPNPNLRWEQTRNFNIGLDYSVINNRISGYIEYYNKYTTDVIAPEINDPTNGFNTITANTAEISNKGMDFNIKTLNIDKEFKWSTTLNFSYNKNKIEKLYVNSGMDASYFTIGTYVALQYIEGAAIDQMYSYRWAGLDSEGYAQVYDKDNNIISAKKSTNLKSEDLVNEGRTQPPYFGNFTNTFSWKDLSLTFNITYKFNYKTRAYSYRYDYFKFNNDRWRNAGDETKTDVPGIHYGTDYSYLYATYGTNNTIDASHIRLNYINLSYSLPKNILKNSGIKDVNLRFQAANLGIIWKANNLGIDPDAHSLEGLRSTLPALKTYTFGVNIKF